MPGKDDLTPTESAILVVLLAEARDISNKELEEKYGFTLNRSEPGEAQRPQIWWRAGRRGVRTRTGSARRAGSAAPVH